MMSKHSVGGEALFRGAYGGLAWKFTEIYPWLQKKKKKVYNFVGVWGYVAH